MIEMWKDIKDYEGLYQISNTGKVKRLYSKVLGKDGKLYTVNERILQNRYMKGYAHVQLSKEGNAKEFSVHRLVAEAFIPNPDNLPFVNHKDENPSNNCVDNLEWCTPKYNTNYGNCRKKMSEKAKSHIGDKNNFYGKHHSETTKKSISEHRKGKLCCDDNPMRVHNIDFRGKNNPRYGKHCSEETRAKIGRKSRQRFKENPRVWVKKDDVGKFILKSDLDIYLSDGYELGRPFKRRTK